LRLVISRNVLNE